MVLHSAEFAQADRRSSLVELDAATCRRLESITRTEWLESDALGGHAALTVAMCATRRQHGLLCVSAGELARPHLFLSRFEEHLTVAGEEHALSTARYPGVWSPEGWRTLRAMRLAPYPVWEHEVAGVRLVREILMPPGQRAVLCRYRVEAGEQPIVLTLRPLTPFRAADELTVENAELDPRTEHIPDGFRCQPYDALPALSITAPGAELFRAAPTWYRSVEYREDLARGLEAHEDHWSPGLLQTRLEAGDEWVVAATVGTPIRDPRRSFEQAARARRARLINSRAGVRGRLELAAEHFLVKDELLPSYPFAAQEPSSAQDEARSLRSVAGLLLARRRIDTAADLLSKRAAQLLSDDAAPDAPRAARLLDVADAVRLCDRAGLSRERLLDEFHPLLDRICGCLEALAGAVGEAKPDGLLRCDGPARLDWNAAWYAAVAHREELAQAGGTAGAARRLQARRRSIRAAFLKAFWRTDLRSLRPHETTEDDPHSLPDATAIEAAARELSPLTRPERVAVVTRAERELLTPRGLRAQPDEAAEEAQSADPARLAAFVEASLRAYGPRRDVIRRLRAQLEDFTTHLDEGMLNHVSAAFDAAPPHRPRGAPADALALAELLRAWRMVEDRQA